MGEQGVHTPAPPTLPTPHTGPGTAQKGLGPPSPTGTQRWPPASVSPPMQYAHTRPHQNQTIVQRAAGFPTLTSVALRVCAHTSAQGPWRDQRFPSASQLCRPKPSLPQTVSGPGLWRAQVSAPVITRKVELAPLLRPDGWQDTALIMGEIQRLGGQ